MSFESHRYKGLFIGIWKLFKKNQRSQAWVNVGQQYHGVPNNGGLALNINMGIGQYIGVNIILCTPDGVSRKKPNRWMAYDGSPH
jgi:hypothetical protein